MNLYDFYFDETMKENETRKINCKCSPPPKSKSLAITFKYCDGVLGWVFYCHRCHMSGFKPLIGLSPDRMVNHIKSRKENTIEEYSNIYLPKDFTNNIPDKGLVWLYKYDITNVEIVKYNIGYSAYYDRVILPVYDSKRNLVFYQGRYLGEPSSEHPKYVNVKAKRDNIYFNCAGTNNKVVLVEDILSAIKVNRVGYETIALLYATVPLTLAEYLHNKYVYIWLDADKYKESIKYMFALGNLGIKVKRVITRKDPKSYSSLEIKTILSGEYL